LLVREEEKKGKEGVSKRKRKSEGKKERKKGGKLRAIWNCGRQSGTFISQQCSSGRFIITALGKSTLEGREGERDEKERGEVSNAA